MKSLVALVLLQTLSLALLINAQISPFAFISAGLTYKHCKSNDECRNSRRCLSRTRLSECRDTDTSCICIPDSFISCESSSVCPRGEVCSRFAYSPFICMAPSALAEDVQVSMEDSKFFRRCQPPVTPPEINTPVPPSENPTATPVHTISSIDPPPEEQGTPEPNPYLPPTPSSTPAPIQRGNGLSYDTCSSTADCRQGRECLDMTRSVRGFACCNPSQTATCGCVPDTLVFCEKNDDCEQGEQCVSTRTDVPRCMSTSAREDYNAKVAFSGGGCIDADMLGHLGREKLVYSEHRMKRVMCDVSGSCATPGHVVVWKGKSLMMKTYCAYVPCVQKVKLVNSPRYQLGISVPSLTEGLTFTAFAARYETSIEERFLAAVRRLGLWFIFKINWVTQGVRLIRNSMHFNG